MTPDEKIAYLEKLVIKLANIIAEFVDTDPNTTAGILSEWVDHATDYDPETGWRVNYPKDKS